VRDWEWAVAVVKYSMSQLVRSLGKHQRDNLEQVELVDKIREEFLREDLPPSSGRKTVGELTEGQIHKLCERLTEDYYKIDKAIQHLLKVGEIKSSPQTRHGAAHQLGISAGKANRMEEKLSACGAIRDFNSGRGKTPLIYKGRSDLWKNPRGRSVSHYEKPLVLPRPELIIKTNNIYKKKKRRAVRRVS
jgi:hypothetical protein